MKTKDTSLNPFDNGSITKILLKSAPPVMLAQLIQALYNIVDGFFVGRYSADALTATSILFPIQLIIVALGVGTGTGVNAYMARKYAQKEEEKANFAGGTGIVLAIFTWLLVVGVTVPLMRPFVSVSATSPQAIEDGVTYGLIVCVGSLGILLESIFTKIHQARGNMRLPMFAQILGALTNIIMDPVLIFGLDMGIAGAAIATVMGQFVACIITGIRGFRKPPKGKIFFSYAKRIYFYGYSSIVMQSLYTVYIMILNIILKGFSDSAVTVLGLYYKMQSFFFIPLNGLSTCIVPVISYHHALCHYKKCKDAMRFSFLVSALFMVIGTVCFVFFPESVIRIFSNSEEVLEIGKIAFPIIGSSFISAVFSLILPVFFQSIGDGIKSLILSLLRQIFCLVPFFYGFSLIGLNYTWLAFPVSETLVGAVGLILFFRELKKWKKEEQIALSRK